MAQLQAHLLAQLRIQIGQRLIEQHHGRAAHQSAGNRHALLLPPGQLRSAACGELAQPHHLERFGDAALALGRGNRRHLQRKRHVLPHAHVWPHGVRLEHHGDVAGVGGYVNGPACVKHLDRADTDRTVRWRFEASHAAQGGRLAAAARAEQRHELAFFHAQRNPPYRRLPCARIGERQVADVKHGSITPCVPTGAARQW